MRLALFQPDIPQNVGAAIRLSACLGVILEIIEPCGFPLSDRAVRRAALDYADLARVERRASWTDFLAADERRDGRLVLFTTKGAAPFTEFAFQPGDTLLFGRESAGVPDAVHDAAQARLLIPLMQGARSLNLATAAAMGLGEALRQTRGFRTGAFAP
ncbi:MAG TPA: tRNA (cytidine(34)-2'-O)-methyltransferase [Caulobacteraceae bacterium]|jgi:tRNA (cytidine/uridine-2'-O-)-methyltransferase|nr:tRNA (cytidine(34)-2'-O)-methyltransferase [Caulobacteraceae bacterium]